MGMLSKNRGRGYEYRLEHYFCNEKQNPNQPLGWKAKRNPLSGASEQLNKNLGKHDVRAWKTLPVGEIFLQIEAKKTAKPFHTIQWKWIEQINFFNDELLVIGWQRTDHFAFIELDAYYKLVPTIGVQLAVSKLPVVKYTGDACFRLHANEVDKATIKSPHLCQWTNHNKTYAVFPLTEYVEAREKLPPSTSRPKQDSNDEVKTKKATSVGEPLLLDQQDRANKPAETVDTQCDQRNQKHHSTHTLHCPQCSSKLIVTVTVESQR